MVVYYQIAGKQVGSHVVRLRCRPVATLPCPGTNLCRGHNIGRWHTLPAAWELSH
ncbi:uncharacterized protein BO88DRAFT_401746 [Aspergillus vadensis CBS 113365]|uniref:Uncharacterized protein n=1 Tax=Aspergillus vadensis (strain CBS 113365 / IMI 142717 / IBT 24658) TaxID=1448311 RepID=A0A319BJ03_ASPVC|nr:hypothetical protein BO88DRAFT_401746 [Aspergillus vadensis CBS 113365]PYH72607.1 hypothetical protein BO88DRAFT_401746 [Aspergillus vadensis CBS 113365]